MCNKTKASRKIRFPFQGNAGFSIVELSVVMAIMAIISVIAVPNLMLYSRRAKQKEAIAQLSSLYGNMRVTRAQIGNYVGDFVSVGFRPEGDLVYRISLARSASALPVPDNWYCDRKCISTSNTCEVFLASNACAGAVQGTFSVWNETNSAIAHNLGLCNPRTTANTFIACASADLGAPNPSHLSMNQNKEMVIESDGTAD